MIGKNPAAGGHHQNRRKNMSQQVLYSIGKVSKICDVSQRMLRYYEEVGLIEPDKIAEPSHYRYYSVQTMRRIQVIRYLIDEGFRLEEIKKMLFDEDLEHFQDMFLQKIDQTQEEIEYYHQRLDSLKAWYALLVEGRAVYRHQNRAITMRYVPPGRYFYYERQRQPDEQDSGAFLETEYFTQSKRNGHSMVDMGGAFHVKYDSVQERMEGDYRHMMLLQTMFPNSKSTDNTLYFGGFLAITSYHIGSQDEVRDDYERMLLWAQQHCFHPRGDCLERHVLDIYSTAREENFVTELLLPVEEDTMDFARLEEWNLKK